MRVLGYVISERKLTLEYAFLKQVKSAEEAKNGMPILYVGWSKIKEHPGYKSIIENRLSDNEFWSFSRSENRSKFEQELKKFATYCINNAVSNVKYKYVNVIMLGVDKLKKLISIIKSGDNIVYVSGEGMAYIPYKEWSLGISFTILEYCGIEKHKAYNWLLANRVVFTDKELGDEKRFLGDRKYAIPFVAWSV